MRVTYVTGVSGSGKTSVRQAVADLYPNVLAVDLDADRMPQASHVEYLRWHAAELLHDATLEFEKPVEHPEPGGGDPEAPDRVITGIVWPHAVIDSTAWQPAVDAGIEVRFLLLDRPWDDVLETMEPRLVDWEAEDRNEQLVLNRIQGRKLRSQVRATRTGRVVVNDTSLAPADLADIAVSPW